MAKNQVTLTLAGDAKSLERAFDRAGAGAKEMAGDFEDAAKRSRRFGDSVSDAGGRVGDQESKFMGTADVLDGLSTAMGFNIDRQIELARAAGDIAGGVENLKDTIGGSLKRFGDLTDKFTDVSKGAVKAQVATVRAAATQGVAWLKSSVQAMAAAVRIRAAWLISIGPIALVVAAVAGAVYLVVRYWDEIKAAAAATWEWVRDKFNALKDFLVAWAPLLAGPVGLVVKYWQEIKDGASAVKDWVVGRFNELVAWLGDIPGRIGRNLTGPFEGIKGGASTAKGWVQERFNELVAWLGDIPGRIGRNLTGAWDGIKGGATDAREWIKARFEEAITWLGGVPGRIGGKLGNAFSALADAFRKAWNYVANKINSVADFKISLPGPIPDVHVNFPNVPTFHVGGIVPGPPGTAVPIMALAGERVVAPGQARGAAPVVNVYALDPRAAASAVVQAIFEHERRNGPVFARY